VTDGRTRPDTGARAPDDTGAVGLLRIGLLRVLRPTPPASADDEPSRHAAGALQKDTFRRRVRDDLDDTGQLSSGTIGKPARLYRRRANDEPDMR
jgi:hypothetical protein